MNILFLDDNPNRHAAFRNRFPVATHVHTVDDCWRAILTEAYDAVFLDHDLGGEAYVDSSRADCGMEIVRRVCNIRTSLGVSLWVVHSHNEVAAKEMEDLLRLNQSSAGVLRKCFKEICPGYQGI